MICPECGGIDGHFLFCTVGMKQQTFLGFNFPLYQISPSQQQFQETPDTDPFGLDCPATGPGYSVPVYQGAIGDWIDAAQQADLCGVFPFVTPPQFPLTPCCINHDNNYMRIRALFIKEYLQDSSLIHRIDEWRPQILTCDEEFYTCTLHYLNSQPFFLKPFLRPFVQAFNRLVRECGWFIWHRGTLSAIADIQKDEEFVKNHGL